MTDRVIRLQEAPFDYGAECAAFAGRAGGAGAVVTFLGLVRNDGGSLTRMEIDHYPGMTEAAIDAIAAEAATRFRLNRMLVLHRTGPMHPGEPIMMVATASRHRAEAFAAAEFLMDYLKSRAPFWKKEHRAEGSSWVAARDADEEALDRWAGGAG